MTPDFTLAQKLAIWALPILFAITIREIVHGYVARSLGDDTATREGRLSPNPLRHIDPVGTVLVPALLIAIGGFLMGWPKRIPVDFTKFRKPRTDLAVVTLAALASNIVMAVMWTGLLKLALGAGDEPGPFMGLRYMSLAGISINLSLFVISLLPIPPFDGGRILMGLLPVKQAMSLARIEPYGFFIVLGLMVFGILQKALVVPLVFCQGLLFAAFDIDFSLLM